jgi:hypothetical protein
VFVLGLLVPELFHGVEAARMTGDETHSNLLVISNANEITSPLELAVLPLFKLLEFNLVCWVFPNPKASRTAAIVVDVSTFAFPAPFLKVLVCVVKVISQ